MFEKVKRFIALRKERRLKNKSSVLKPKKQYTKTLVTSVTIMACIWITTSYVFAGVSLFMYGNTEPLSELSQQICITILGTVAAYTMKSYFETKSEKAHEIQLMSQGVISSHISNGDDEVCG